MLRLFTGMCLLGIDIGLGPGYVNVTLHELPKPAKVMLRRVLLCPVLARPYD